MKTNKIKILSIGEYCDAVKKFRLSSNGIEKYFTFVQTDFDGFIHNKIDYNVLLFVINPENTESVINVFSNTAFDVEPPVILICSDEINEENILKIPFKNKLIFRESTAFEDLKYNISVILKKAELEKKIREFQSNAEALNRLVEDLKLLNDHHRINNEELIQTNVHLVSATWREREGKKLILNELEQVKKENDFNKTNIDELSATNCHLIAATWRERDLKKKLKEAMDDLQQSKNLIETQSRRISESINYSRRIQNVILPDEEVIKKDLEQSFILYIPKNVVSGDFPFYYKNENAIYLAAVDCTGHGVPGAMLSLIGNLTLKDVIKNSGENSPAEILAEMHSKIVKVLKQDIPTNDASDGMDMALCKIDLRNQTVYFAGAHLPMFFISNNELLEFKGSRLPIGGNQYKNKTGYINHEVKIKAGDSMFVFSDGFPDQFGFKLKEKYGPVRIKNFLLENQQMSMNQLKDSLKNEFEEWKGEEKQMDDILFMGVKF